MLLLYVCMLLFFYFRAQKSLFARLCVEIIDALYNKYQKFGVQGLFYAYDSCKNLFTNKEINFEKVGFIYLNYMLLKICF